MQRVGRVPRDPSWIPFSWVVETLRVSEDDLLHMVGLDGYMLMRYLGICLRVSIFLSFFGCVVLVPVYSHAQDTPVNWNRYTLANIPTTPGATQLWVPVLFSYVFAIYYCFLMHTEYRNFMAKRLQYLLKGDPDTPIQTYYTVMLEHLPSQLRTASQLFDYFETLFPGNICEVLHCIVLCCVSVFVVYCFIIFFLIIIGVGFI